jgi:hypothetical protein
MSIGKIVSATAASGHKIAVEWDDGRHATIDLSAVITAHPALGALSDEVTFANGEVAPDGWSIEWPGGIDFGTAQLRRWADEQAGETMPAAAFRRWMDTHSFTLDSAAAALGLSRRTIAYYLSGEQPVPKTVMLATLGYETMKAA